jgi:hypothetical protein
MVEVFLHRKLNMEGHLHFGLNGEEVHDIKIFSCLCYSTQMTAV